MTLGVTDSFYGEGKGPILLDNVECLGVESTVLECVYDTHTADCSHSQDAGVICHPCKFKVMGSSGPMYQMFVHS